MLLLTSTPAWAQPSPAATRPAREGRVEVSGGMRFNGATDLGNIPATETATGGRTRTIFDSDNALDGAIGLDARLGVLLTRAFQIEGAVSLTPTHLSSRLTNDTDGAASVTAETPVMQWLIEGGVLARLGRWRPGLMPFLTAGAGYLRHVHDGRTLIESGRSYYVGAGADYIWKATGRGAVKGAGLRADIRAGLLQDGALLDDELHLSPVASVGLFVMF